MTLNLPRIKFQSNPPSQVGIKIDCFESSIHIKKFKIETDSKNLKNTITIQASIFQIVKLTIQAPNQIQTMVNTMWETMFFNRRNFFSYAWLKSIGIWKMKWIWLYCNFLKSQYNEDSGTEQYKKQMYKGFLKSILQTSVRIKSQSKLVITPQSVIYKQKLRS